jgi:hypothetical protein
MRSVLLMLALLLPTTVYGAETLGRLFFSPDQRAQLDMLRTKRVVASQTKEEPPPEVVTYNGIVRRSDGKTTVWVNNQSMSEADLRDKPAIAGRVSRDGKIVLQATQPGTARTQLKVGQSAELLSGQVAESYNAAANTARDPKPEAAPKTAPSTANKDSETPTRSAQSERAGDGNPPATAPTTRP